MRPQKPKSRVKFILIMQKLYNLLPGENSVILFYNNTLMIYLVILSDFDNLTLHLAYLPNFFPFEPEY